MARQALTDRTVERRRRWADETAGDEDEDAASSDERMSVSMLRESPGSSPGTKPRRCKLRWFLDAAEAA